MKGFKLISKELLEILRCPETKAKLFLYNDKLISLDPNSRRCYSIIDGTPILLIEKSIQLSLENWQEIIKGLDDKI